MGKSGIANMVLVYLCKLGMEGRAKQSCQTRSGIRCAWLDIYEHCQILICSVSNMVCSDHLGAQLGPCQYGENIKKEYGI